MTNKTDFIALINDLLFLENDAERLQKSVQKFYLNLLSISEFGGNSSILNDETETLLKTGKAISPKDAAGCLLDFVRTTEFLRGIYAAICQAKQIFPNEKIQILYAGCGPFSALAVPQCAVFAPEEISFTLIDIHQLSIDSARKVFDELGFNDYVKKFIRSDAAVYRESKGEKFHIIITETMQKTLEKEPQAAITLNLTNQIQTKGFFIPQKVTITANLVDIKNELNFSNLSDRKRERISLGVVLELPDDSENILRQKTFELPEMDFDGMCVMLSTEIEVFGKFRINEYDSGITYPTFFYDLTIPESGGHLNIKYIIDENPHFQYKIV